MGGWVGGWVGAITCIFFIFIFFVPMSTIDDYWSMFVPPPVARGRLRYARSTTTARGRSEAL